MTRAWAEMLLTAADDAKVTVAPPRLDALLRRWDDDAANGTPYFPFGRPATEKPTDRPVRP